MNQPYLVAFGMKDYSMIICKSFELGDYVILRGPIESQIHSRIVGA